MQDQASTIFRLARSAGDRLELWRTVATELGVRRMAEIGVQSGRFASSMLDGCPAIETYYLVDPWRHLDGWNKPANVDDASHEACFREAVERTKAHAGRCSFLRGTTAEMSARIPDGALDFAYIDGDHSLRGIVIDLVRMWPKIRTGGIIGGDDFVASIFQHGPGFEPTMVFPLAVHFAEAVDAEILVLPFDQFAILKSGSARFRFHDPDGSRSDTSVASQLARRHGGGARGLRAIAGHMRRLAGLDRRPKR